MYGAGSTPHEGIDGGNSRNSNNVGGEAVTPATATAAGSLAGSCIVTVLVAVVTLAFAAQH